MSAIRRNVPLPVNAYLAPGETVVVKFDFDEHCVSKSLHIPGSYAEYLLLVRAKYENFERTGPIGCSVFSGLSEIDPFQARTFFPGQPAFLTFENRAAMYIHLYGSLVVEVD